MSVAAVRTLWGIADLHLSFARPENRARHAGRWADHARRIEGQWRATVGPGDVVVIPGDVSMALNHREVQPDLAWLDSLPGTKVLSAGNHDGWFNRVGAVRPLMRRTLRVVGGDAVRLPGLVVCGTRGVPPMEPGEASDALRRAIDRERQALDSALSEAARLREGEEPVVALWHYPPFDEAGRPGACVTALEAAKVDHCVYGHVHAAGQWSRMAQGFVGSVRYHCVAADAIGFRPLKLATLALT